MSISSISSSSLAGAAQALVSQRNAPSQSGSALGVAAQALGLSTSDLSGQLQDGKTLADIAKTQGVSRDDLAAALKAGMPSDGASRSDADSIVDSIIDRVGGVGGPSGGSAPQGPPPPPPPAPSNSTTGLLSGTLTSDQQSTLNTLSSLLDTDSTSLLSSLQNGTSLADLADNAGVSSSTLASVLQDGLLFDTRA
ncbi:hypothetical protein [Kineosporia sp. NBRC 101731]|uniref:hypothetical protein n=1 Tax=Kineosporia sp. NBRC 101731 TaxID=3032199 RepID=UPI0024A237CB|nr:hypothetical protein [Kineosporia sp. NBRC 101731]GLY27302.1 hypothetical protein Kisp02_06670 [Kineosporia sp. NBRC 101731]